MTQLYTNYKIFHFHDKLNALAEGRVTAPVHVRLKPTNRCNHHCSYCCYRTDRLHLCELMDQRDEIPAEKMREITRDLISMCVKAVTFSGGGEPLCYPHFRETAETLMDGGIKIALLTNGSLLEGEIAELLGERASWVRVSMDAADGETYARTRGAGKEEFKKVCDNIARFAREKGNGCQLGVNFVVSAENQADVYAFPALMKKLGVDHVKISECVVSTKSNENNAYHTPLFQPVKEQISQGIQELVDSRFAIIDRYTRHGDSSYAKEYTCCPFIQCLAVIGADLNVYTCQDKAYTSAGLIGTLKDRSFREVWMSEATRERLTGINPQQECNHHCVQDAKNRMLLDYCEVDRGHLEFV